MSSLILLIIFGLGMAYFATQNTATVHVVIANYLFSGIPMYVVVIVSLLIGIVTSWFISAIDVISSTFTIYGKDHEIKKSQEAIKQLQERVHDLEIENAHLESGIEIEEPRSGEKKHIPSFTQRLKHSFG